MAPLTTSAFAFEGESLASFVSALPTSSTYVSKARRTGASSVDGNVESLSVIADSSVAWSEHQETGINTAASSGNVAKHHVISERIASEQYFKNSSINRTLFWCFDAPLSLALAAISRSRIFHSLSIRVVTRVSAYVLSSAPSRPVARKTSRNSRAAVLFCDSSAVTNAGRTMPSSLCSNASTLSCPSANSGTSPTTANPRFMRDNASDMLRMFPLANTLSMPAIKSASPLASCNVSFALSMRVFAASS
mmetsp:Transcript_4990/g.16745  ORF Transcript_4990/g.16745 Transcript_4990/m.16745 type:complete len:249 (-) Transcript_4990:535-1281(-)